MEDNELSEIELESDKVGNGKICKECGQFRDRSEYRNHPRAKDGLQTVCIICKPTYKKSGHNENLEKIPTGHTKMTLNVPNDMVDFMKNSGFSQIKKRFADQKKLYDMVGDYKKKLKSENVRITVKSSNGSVTFESKTSDIQINIERIDKID